MARFLHKFVLPGRHAKGLQIMIFIAGLILMIFALMGIAVTREHEIWHRFAWLPVILFLAAAGLMVFAVLRLKRAAAQKASKYTNFGY